MTYETIRLEAAGDHVQRLVLARPPLNILSIAMLEEIADAIEEAARAAPRVVVIAAEGKAFSAGVDVEDHVGDRVRPMIAAFHGVFRRLAALAPPTVAVVHGAALGGGCELAGACDLVLAADTAAFGQPEIRLGLFPPVTAAAFPAAIGVRRTLELMLTGEPWSAEEARRAGLVTRVWPAAELAGRAEEFVARLAGRSGVALALSKRAVTAGLGLPFDDALLAAERIYLEELMATEDAREGLEAFRAKREPEWRDR